MQSIALLSKVTCVFSLTCILACLPACKEQVKNEPATSMEEQKPALSLNIKASGDIKNKKIVLISGDEEYRSEEGLPQIAKILSQHHGFDCTVLFAQDPSDPGL